MNIDNQIVLFTIALSMTEIGLGSLLHSFKIPFSGHALSLNQAFLLSVLNIRLRNTDRLASIEVSTATAILKSLSPAGKKLTPMLAISAQGFLHNIGILLIGRNFIGIALANALCSLWAFIQPWFIYYILYSKDLIAMGEYFIKKLAPIAEISIFDIGIAVGIFVFIKILISLGITVLAFKIKEDKLDAYISYLLKQKPKTPNPSTSIVKGVMKDITSPLFIFSFLLMSSFYFLTGTNAAIIFWKILRPLALAIIIFTFLRIIPMQGLIAKIDKLGLKRLSQILKQVLDKINN